MMPGVLHCAGGPGPERVDWAAAIDEWVEKGKAPDRASSRARWRPTARRVAHAAAVPVSAARDLQRDGEPGRREELHLQVITGTSRRTFLSQLGGVAASLAVARSQGPPDLLIAGGRVVDPVRGFAGLADVAIAGDRIVQVGPGLPRAAAKQVVDARGAIVAPGLIDVHGHVYDEGIPTSVDPDFVGVPTGVTTIVDGGSTGASTFPGFRRYVIARARTRVLAWLNISTIGLAVNNEIYLDPRMIDVAAAVRTIREHPAIVLGLKVRVTGRDEDVPHDVEVMKKAREAADTARVPIMMHWSNDLRLLDLLKSGDVMTHPFNPPRAGPDCLGPEGKVRPQILELRARGVLIDFAHGTHLLWETAEKAAAQGFYPDTISTDVHRAHIGPNGVVGDLVTTMTKFVRLGLTVDQAIEKVTAAPARMLKFPERIGTLEPGAVADVSVLAVEDGKFDLLDSARQPRTASSRIVAKATVRAGRL